MFFFFARPEYSIMRHPAWSRIIAVLDVVRREHPTMTVGMLHTLLHIAKHQPEFDDDNTDMKKISSQLEMPYSTFVRQTDILGEGVGKRGGLALVEKRLLGESQKVKIVDFTDDGVALLSRMWDALIAEDAEQLTVPSTTLPPE